MSEQRHILEVAADGTWRLDGEPWRPDSDFYAVLGDPVAHSLLPALHNAALQDRGLPAVCVAARVPVGHLAALRERGAAAGMAGFNLTAPLEEAAAGLCAGRTDVARELGAVDTVKLDGDRWLGHNTNSGGIRAVLAEVFRHRPAPQRALVLGAGGSARAAIHALDGLGLDEIEIRSRSGEDRRHLERWLAQETWSRRARCTVLPLEPRRPAPAALVVVALAGGEDPTRYLPPTAEGESGVSPGAGADLAPATGVGAELPPVAGVEPEFPPEPGAGPVVLDLRYGGQRPDAVLPAGAHPVDGKPVLLMQGGLAFAWWFGMPVPWQAMRRALD
ncbi:MAG: hypothetical protein R6X25_14455 [Candidatus Krumholzibacteriia bacterium]